MWRPLVSSCRILSKFPDCRWKSETDYRQRRRQMMVSLPMPQLRISGSRVAKKVSPLPYHVFAKLIRSPTHSQTHLWTYRKVWDAFHGACAILHTQKKLGLIIFQVSRDRHCQQECFSLSRCLRILWSICMFRSPAVSERLSSVYQLQTTRWKLREEITIWLYHGCA
jgi:hypothetical protein